MSTQELRIQGHRVKVVRSARRRKTISANWEDGLIRLQIPATLSKDEELRWAERMVTKLHRRSGATDFGQEQLENLAAELNERYFDGAATPSEVVFSSRQNTLWGSCSRRSRKIRLNQDLARMPQWVLEGVLVHELAHLLEPNHGPRFKALEARYERIKEVHAFLAGVSHIKSGPGGANANDVPGTLDDDGAELED
ncbi:SprT-like domain-containing protein [Micrococcoides hystricis]|uniref:SprT-like domain-containing protein n=1 Tax=Micrococcoides hystricis TaxID=1572761 RepID=A0ABV6P8A7_9MICC